MALGIAILIIKGTHLFTLSLIKKGSFKEEILKGCSSNAGIINEID